MYRALMATEAPLSADDLRQDLEDAGMLVIETNSDASTLAEAAVRVRPDLIIAASASPSNSLFEAARMLGTLAPCPFIVFTSDADAAKIERASGSGVHAYVVDGYARHRLLSITQVAQARFRHEREMREELDGLSRRFEERKLVDRAKGALMRSRGVTEEDAFELLRSLAMQSRQRIGVVAMSVIDMSRAGETVNRSGQLRMLSQRVVKAWLQVLAGAETAVEPAPAQRIMADCVARVKMNLGILRKAIDAAGTSGFGELVDRVSASWEQVENLCAEPPDAARIDTLDAAAEVMLKDAETLTEFLENSGLVSSLHVINLSGRQRMLSQRIAKLCFMIAREPTADRLSSLRESTADFQSTLDDLTHAPLSSPAIRTDLQVVVAEWRSLNDALAALQELDSLERVSAASERLLDAIEGLTDRYEQAMQTLIGNRIGRMKTGRA